MQVQHLLSAVPGYRVDTPSCDLSLMLGAVVGATMCALGAAIVAVLVLRAQSEWKITTPGTPPPARRPS
jgi:hypothetical protein